MTITEAEVRHIALLTALKTTGALFVLLGVSGLVGFVALLMQARAYAYAAVDAEIESLQALEASLREKAVGVDALRAELPLGTILPVGVPAGKSLSATWVETLPRNWVVCDGSKLDGSHPRRFRQDEVASEYWNESLPDLRDRFLYGTVDVGSVGELGGIDELPQHAHPLPRTTGSIADGGPALGGHRYRTRDDNQGEGNDVHLTVDGGDSSREGQHRHALGGETALNPSVAFVPQHYRVVFIMRIR